MADNAMTYDVYLKLYPSLDDFLNKARKELIVTMDDVARDVGKKMGEGIVTSLRDSLRIAERFYLEIVVKVDISITRLVLSDFVDIVFTIIERALDGLETVLLILSHISTIALNVTRLILLTKKLSKTAQILSGVGLGIVGVLLFIATYMLSTGTSFDELIEMIRGFITTIFEMSRGLASLIEQYWPEIESALRGIFIELLAMLPGLINQGIQILLGFFEVFMAMMPQIIEIGIAFLLSLIKGFTYALPQLIDAVVSIIDNVLNVIVTALPIIIEVGLGLFMGLVEALSHILPPLITGINTLIRGFIGIFPILIPPLLSAAIQLFTALVSALRDILPVLLDGLIVVIMALVEIMPTLIPVILDAAIMLFTMIVEALVIILPLLIDAGIQLIMAVVDLLPTLIPVILDAAIALFLAIVEALPIIIPQLIDAGIQLIMAVVEMLPTLIPILIAAAIALFMGIVDAVSMVLVDLLNAIGELIQDGIDAVGTFFANMIAAGENLIMGIVNGIANGIDWVLSIIGDLCNAALGAIMGFFGIRSPSSVMAEMGSYLMQGFAEGIEDEGSTVIAALDDITHDVIDIMDDLSSEIDIPVALSLGKPSWAITSPGMVDNDRGNTYYTIGDVSYAPDSRMAELMAEVMNILVRENNMRRVSYA